MNKLVVFIPAFNEEKNIAEVIKSVPKKIDKYKTEILVVDDGSRDKTEKVAQKAGAIVVKHHRNMGVGKAFQTGLEKAIDLSADAMVNIDADGQFDPKEIPHLVKPIIDKGYDFVASDRFFNKNTKKLQKPENMPISKYWGNLLMAKLISFLANQQFNDVSCGFRAYSKKAMMSLNLMGKFTYTQESFLDLALKGLHITTIPVSVKYFPSRKSRVAHNLLYYAWKTIKIIIRSFRDYKPLLFFFYLSLVPTLVSLFSGLFLSYHYYINGQFTPYKSIGFIFIYFSSLTFILLLFGFIADMFVRLRINQEKILYQMKLQCSNKS